MGSSAASSSSPCDRYIRAALRSQEAVEALARGNALPHMRDDGWS